MTSPRPATDPARSLPRVLAIGTGLAILVVPAEGTSSLLPFTKA